MTTVEFNAAVGPSAKEKEQFFLDAALPSITGLINYANKYPNHLDVRDGEELLTALMITSGYGHAIVTKVLCQLGADTECVDAQGRKARDFAVMHNKDDCVKAIDNEVHVRGVHSYVKMLP